MRNAFRDFACEKREIIGQGARTSMSGAFERAFKAWPVDPIQPNGVPMRLELINLFRYDAEGRPVEEWVQYDNLGFLKQLGVALEKTSMR